MISYPSIQNKNGSKIGPVPTFAIANGKRNPPMLNLMKVVITLKNTCEQDIPSCSETKSQQTRESNPGKIEI